MKNKKPSEKILKSAYDCLSEYGFANVSMRDIAKESGTALSQLTYYYKTKENLFLEVIDMMMERYLREARANMRKEKSAKRKLASLSGYFGQIIKKEPRFMRLLVDFTAQAMWVDSFKQKMESMFDGFSGMIEQEIIDETGQARGNSASVAKLIFGALFGTSVQIMLGSGDGEDCDSLDLTQCLLL
jgi:AcrR family transcriptional regulator